MARFVSNLSRRIVVNDYLWNSCIHAFVGPFTRARSHRNARAHVATHHAFDLDRAVRGRRRRLARDEGGVARRHAIIRGVDVASRERRGARVDVDVDVDYG